MKSAFKKPVQKITCPRRMIEFGPWKHEEALDEFRPGGGIVGQSLSCSFCGSYPPDLFLEAVKAGAEVGPTDKSYKFYVNGIKRDESENPASLRVVGHAFVDVEEVKRENYKGYVSWAEMNREQKNAVKEYNKSSKQPKEELRKNLWLFRPIGDTFEAKFYTHHLSTEQGDEFIKLWRAGKINWGYPGHPYVRLYIPHTQEENSTTRVEE